MIQSLGLEQRHDELGPQGPAPGVPATTLRLGGPAAPADHFAEDEGLGREANPLAGEPEGPGELHVLDEAVGAPGMATEPAARQAHPVAPKAGAQAQPLLAQEPDAVEQAEAVGQELGPPRGVAVADGIVALDPVLPLGQRPGEGDEDLRIDDAIC